MELLGMANAGDKLGYTIHPPQTGMTRHHPLISERVRVPLSGSFLL